MLSAQCCCLVKVMSDSFVTLVPARLLCPGNFPGENTGEGCHFLLQRILPTQRSNLHLLRWQVDLPLSHMGKECPNSQINVVSVKCSFYCRICVVSMFQEKTRYMLIPKFICLAKSMPRTSVHQYCKAHTLKKTPVQSVGQNL